MTKKLIMMIAAAMLLAAIPAAASADYTEGYFEYILGDNCVEITGYFGDETETTVPARIAGYPVCVIRAGAFADADSLSLIILPDTVMEVQSGAFSGAQTVIYTTQETATQSNDTADQSAQAPAADSTEAAGGQPEAAAEDENSGIETVNETTDLKTASSEPANTEETTETNGTAVIPKPGQTVVYEEPVGSEELEFDDQAIKTEQARKQETKKQETAAKEKELAQQKASEEEKAEQRTIEDMGAEKPAMNHPLPVLLTAGAVTLIAGFTVYLLRNRKLQRGRNS